MVLSQTVHEIYSFSPLDSAGCPLTGWLTHLKSFQHYSPTPSHWIVHGAHHAQKPVISSHLFIHAHSSPFKGPININRGAVFVVRPLLSGLHDVVSCCMDLVWQDR